MADALHYMTAERNQSHEYAVSQAVQQDADFMRILVANYPADIIASLKSAMSNPINEAHLAGGKHGDPSNAIGDEARNELAEKSATSPMKAYEASIMEKQSADPKYLHNPTTGDAFKASEEAQQFANEMQSWMALEAHTSGSELMAATAASPSFGGAETPDNLTDATIQSARGGVFGEANPVTGKEAQGKSQMDNAKNKVRESGAIGALKESGASMGKQSLSGDGGKSLGAAPTVTPNQKEFVAAKREQQSEPVAAAR